MDKGPIYDIYTDELSGTKNRRYLEHVKSRLIPNIRSNSGIYTIAITDLDHFKEINDTHGHLKGDEAIRFFADFLKKNLRNSDVVIRYGGDEFIVIQPELGSREAYIVWDRIVNKLKEENFSGLKLSASCGFSSYPVDGRTFEELFKKADNRLYNAKRSGRGRVGTEDAVKKVRIPCPKHVDRIAEKDVIGSAILEGKIVKIEGEAGIGKTRLIREVLGTVKDMDVLWSDCLALDRKIAYYAVREVAKYRLKRESSNLINMMPDALKIEIAKVIPGIVAKDTFSQGEEVIDRYRLYESFRYILSHGERPKVVVIDNVQWIDEDSIETIKYMVKMDRENKMMFIFASRIEEENETVENFCMSIGRERKIEVIKLRPMSKIHIKEMVKMILQNDLESVADYVADKSSGNPFYSEELVGALFENDFLIVKGGRWHFEVPMNDMLPKSIEDVIRRKIKLLSGETMELLKVLSVAVKGYMGLLTEITGFNESHVFGLVEDGLKAGVIKENEKDDYVEFKSELIRKVVYDAELSRLKKKMLHRKVARWIEDHFPEGMEEDLAYHYYIQGNYEKVAEYGEKAGKKLRNMYANYEALKYFDWAIEAVKKVENGKNTKKLVELLLESSFLLRYMGKYRESEKRAEQAKQLSEEYGLYEFLARAYNTLAWVRLVLGDIDEAKRDVKRVIELADKHNLPEEKLSAFNTLGAMYRDTSESKKAISMYEKALQIARNLGIVKSEAIALNNMAIKFHEDAEFEKALEYYRKSEEITKEHGFLSQTAMIVYNRALVHIDLNNSELAQSLLEEARKLAHKAGFKRIEASVLWGMGYLYTNTGRFLEAEKSLEDALLMFESINDTRMFGVSYSSIAGVYRALGKVRDAIYAHKKAIEIFKSINNTIYMIGEKITLANLLQLTGDFEKSEGYLKEAVDESFARHFYGQRVRALSGLAELYIKSGMAEEAEGILEKAKEILSEHYSPRGSLRFEFAEYEFLKKQQKFKDLPAKVEEMREHLSPEITIDERIAVDIYECDAYIESGKFKKAGVKLEELTHVISTYPHEIFRVDIDYLKWKYNWRKGVKDEKYLKMILEAYEKLGFSSKIEEIDLEKRRLQDTKQSGL